MAQRPHSTHLSLSICAFKLLSIVIAVLWEFFEYFCDDYAPFYAKKYDFLLDFNLEIQQKTLELLNFTKIDFSLSDSYIETTNFNTKDLREVINPKKFNVTLYKNLSTPYYQIFDQKFGFTPNLSIIDLLFNMGNEARIYLKNLMPIN